MQGLSVGGEYTSSIVFLVERASVGYRGLMGAVVCCGTTLGIMLGSGVGATIAALMTAETLDRWGWRILFLPGLVVGVAGFVLRRHVTEASPVERSERSPIVETSRDHWRPVVQVGGFFSLSNFLKRGAFGTNQILRSRTLPPIHGASPSAVRTVTRLPWPDG